MNLGLKQYEALGIYLMAKNISSSDNTLASVDNSSFEALLPAAGAQVLNGQHTLDSWLNHQASLTDKLKSIACDVHLKILSHDWSYPDIWDKQRLKIMADHALLRREIIMWAATHACWYARTIIPKSTFEQEESLFNRLHAKPLGELIWNKAQFKRQSIVQYSINNENLEYHFLTADIHQNAEMLWARLSTISVHDRFEFYLLEIFLPDLKYYLL